MIDVLFQYFGILEVPSEFYKFESFPLMPPSVRKGGVLIASCSCRDMIRFIHSISSSGALPAYFEPFLSSYQNEYFVKSVYS